MSEIKEEKVLDSPETEAEAKVEEEVTKKEEKPKTTKAPAKKTTKKVEPVALSEESLEEVPPKEPTGDAPKTSGVVQVEGLKPFHYYPIRESVFFQIMFPALYEINKVQEEKGEDWQDISNFEGSLFEKDIKTLLYLIDNYENLEIQESRNGYVLDKEDIIKGKFFQSR